MQVAVMNFEKVLANRHAKAAQYYNKHRVLTSSGKGNGSEPSVVEPVCCQTDLPPNAEASI
jgi:hypothetical protein